MLYVRVTSGKLTSAQMPAFPGPATVLRKQNLLIEGTMPVHAWESPNGNKHYLFGDIVGLRQSDGKLAPSSLLKVEPERLEKPERIPEVEGRFVLLMVTGDGSCEIWTDQFGRVDIYWQSYGSGVIIASTGLDLLPVSRGGANPDVVGVAHALTVYGSRPAKQHTLYQGVRRLGVDQGLRLRNGDVEILRRPTRLASTTPAYVEQDLHRYADHFLEGIRARASNSGNVVYLSSGWDSTSILAALVHLFGKRKTRAIIGRMQYSERSGVINQFEIDRARAVAEYYDVRLDIVELDYRKDVASILDRLRGAFRAQQFASFTGVNHWLLAEGAARTATGDEVVFAGEMSDGAHNLGFSQFVSIFHPASQDFREYSDKMASYLFGPTFLGEMLEGRYGQDPVWQLYQQRNAGLKYDRIAEGRSKIVKQLLASFFLRAGRLPLYSLDNTRLLTAAGRDTYSRESEQTYLDGISEQVAPDTLYAAYLHLYNSFHWQGATVATLEHTTALHGLKCALPFHDGAVIGFLSAMPESWGRGLDLKPTKYPLKWMLRNRLDYPFHLQTGPHSYIYDINPNFTLTGEILYASAYKPLFMEALKASRFVEILDPGIFDRRYIEEEVIQPYLAGKELCGQEMNDLAALAMHSAIGMYGQ